MLEMRSLSPDSQIVLPFMPFMSLQTDVKKPADINLLVNIDTNEAPDC